MENFDWAEEINCAVTVCDTEGNILYMNRRSRDTFGELTGANLLACHSPASVAKIRNMLATGESNSYTIEKKGVRKMIYQTPWRRNGIIAGLVEISMIIPGDMPHYIRS